MGCKARTISWIAAGACWMAASAVGLSQLWRYESVPGTAAKAFPSWPDNSAIVRDVNLPTVVMLLHPHCPCSRASIEELSKLMTHCAGKLSAKVIAIRPAGVTQGWEQTDLARSAAAIPGVEVVADDQGREAQRFGGATSGQTLLFAADGRLLFAGGITESRGHIGDNAGRSAIEAIVLAESNDISTTRETNPGQTPVFGCPLFSERRTSSPTGNDACHIRN